MSWATRRCTSADTAVVRELFGRYDTREFGSPQSDGAEIQALLDRAGDTLLLSAPAPVGFAHVQATGECDTVVDPAADCYVEARRHLVAWVVERGRALGTPVLSHWAAPGHRLSAQALRPFGFTHTRTSWRMSRALTFPATTDWPADLTVSVATEAQLESVWALVTQAFAGTPYSQARPFDQWREVILHGSQALTARQGGRLVGCAVVGEYLGDGHVRQLAVAPECRGRGWGRAMLLECFARDTASGYSRTTLNVDGDNSSARALYDGVGMTVLEEFWRWDLAL